MKNNAVSGLLAAGVCVFRYHSRRWPCFSPATSPRILPRAGLTLIELLLVLFLLVLVASFAVPNFYRSYQGLIQQQAVEDLVYAMRYAQSQAVIQGQMIRLALADDQAGYWLEVKGADDKADGASFSPLPGTWGREKRIPAGLRATNLSPIHFYPDGTIEKTAFSICGERQCQTISTREQRGKVLVYDESQK